MRKLKNVGRILKIELLRKNKIWEEQKGAVQKQKR